jgi:hypothetical protein
MIQIATRKSASVLAPMSRQWALLITTASSPSAGIADFAGVGLAADRRDRRDADLWFGKPGLAKRVL